MPEIISVSYKSKSGWLCHMPIIIHVLRSKIRSLSCFDEIYWKIAHAEPEFYFRTIYFLNRDVQYCTYLRHLTIFKVFFRFTNLSFIGNPFYPGDQRSIRGIAYGWFYRNFFFSSNYNVRNSRLSHLTSFFDFFKLKKFYPGGSSKGSDLWLIFPQKSLLKRCCFDYACQIRKKG